MLSTNPGCKAPGSAADPQGACSQKHTQKEPDPHPSWVQPGPPAGADQQQATEAQAIAVACDGARKGDGCGGWGVAVCLADGRLLERSGAERDSTNNRMELRAAIEALQLLAQLPHAQGLELATDSRYVLDGLTRWLPGWKRNGWSTSTGAPVKNRRLWERLEQAAAAAPGVRLVWVKGHNGHELNEAADRLATAAAEALQQQPTTAPTEAQASAYGGPIGSSWDTAAGPDEPLPQHLAEWVTGSACHPELAAANLQSLAGAAVLELLAGDRLEQLGGHAQQYATGAVVRLLQRLEPIAAAGGWWCSGLDSLADWAPMRWGTFKPDAPRFDQERGKARKYEHPIAAPARCWWLRVPAAVAQLVADRHDLSLPAAVAADSTGDAGAFWRWWASTPGLPVVVTEGVKKAAALLSAGVPALALPGIWNGSPKDAETGRPVLLADLAAVPLQDRPCWVLFDCPKAGRRNPDEPKAAARLGRLLAAAGAQVLVGTVPGSHGKGADDHLVNGGTWEQLKAALRKVRPAPVLPVLRKPDLIAPAGAYLGESVTIPEGRRVVALACAMGAGKTQLIAQHLAPLQAEGRRVVLITHRRSLGASTAADLGLPWADEAAPGCDLRQTGIGLCADSLCPSSRLRFNAADWSGAVVVIDEVTAVLRHALMAQGTAISRRRVAVLETLGELLARASLVIVADAQLDDHTLRAIETAAGERAYLIGSEHQPAAGRELTYHETRGSWYAALGQQLQQRRPVWISTTAAEATSANSAQNVAVWVRGQWPDARVLVVDAETVADPMHDAHRLARDPDGIAGAHDVVIASPAIAAGLSVTLADHFGAVFVAAGGTTDPGAVAQAAGRVRAGCPRHVYAPDRSPGNHLQIGCGSPFPDRVMRQLRQHEQATVGQLAAAGWSVTSNSAGPWLQLWAQAAAQQNGARLAFASTVLGLLEREGYSVQQAPETGALCPEILQVIAQAEAEAEQERIIAAPVLSDQQAAQLKDSRKRLSKEERAELQRWRVDRAWGLQGADPSPLLLDAHDDGAARRVVFRWAVTDQAADLLVAAHDRQQAQQQAADGRNWAPDLTAAALGPKVALARALGLARWLERSDWFGPDDGQLRELVAAVTTHSDGIAQVLGVTTAKRSLTTLRRLLALVGARLESRRVRLPAGDAGESDRAYSYRVVVDPLAWSPPKDAGPLPDPVTPEQVIAAWCDGLGQAACPKKSPTDKGGDFGTDPPGPTPQPHHTTNRPGPVPCSSSNPPPWPAAVGAYAEVAA